LDKETSVLPAAPSTKKSGGIYLARSVLGRPRYSVRQSVFDSQTGCLRHRELFDLGGDPARFLIYPFDSYFHIREDLVKAVSGLVAGNAVALLEKILLPFIRKDFRAKLESSLDRRQSLRSTPVTAAELAAIDRELHSFDLRRLHYLWYGAIDQSRLFKMPAKLRRRLLGKSRDEKEQYFIALERALFTDQVKEYLYTVFNLQRFFDESLGRLMPQGLDQAKLDALFIEELCSLNDDPLLWQGMEPVAGLRDYLIRYLILFFDYDFGESEALNSYLRQFMDSHRRFSYPERKRSISLEEASGLFGEPEARLEKLSKRELKKLYRKRAKKLHPDAGGDPEQFVRLKVAFEELLRKR
jgi:hypothetical protein